MTIAITQTPVQAADTSNTVNTINDTITVTAGNMLVVFCNWDNVTATISSVTISGESNATAIAGSLSTRSDIAERWQIAYLGQLSGSGSKTVTLTLSANSRLQIVIFEASGQLTPDPLDTSGAANAFDGTVQVSLTTAAANEAIFVGAAKGDAKPGASGAGYTDYGTSWANISAFNAGEVNVDVGAAGSKTPTMTGGAGQSWLITAAAFKQATVAESQYTLMPQICL